MNISQKTLHFFHVVSNIRPIVWIGIYVAAMPVFACIYAALPDSQFRIPDGAATDWWSWLYYSIVTITTLGFGDYTPAHAWAQAFTAVEVMLGLVILGLFLNAVGSMKSEIDVTSEVEKQKRTHFALEMRKLEASVPSVLHLLDNFLSFCYAVTTPEDKRTHAGTYNPDFSFSDMAGMFRPSGLPSDHTDLPAVERLMASASRTSLALDSMQQRIDLSLWPDVLDDCFAFVANFQMFSSTDALHVRHDDHMTYAKLETVSKEIAAFKGVPKPSDSDSLAPETELYYFIKENAARAQSLEYALTHLPTPES